MKNDTQELTAPLGMPFSGTLSSIGELAAGVAHEINNPINGIINYAQILVNRLPRGSIEAQLADRIIAEGERVAGIVRSLLSVASPELTERSSVSISNILSECLALIGAQFIAEGIHLIVDVPADLPSVMCNQKQVQQVFLNIISNARFALNQKQTGYNPGKILRIQCRTIQFENQPAILMEFHDTGCGIPAGQIAKVMTPFFTTKPCGSGSGMGLSVSRSIIQNHGGSLTIESRSGEYTKVSVVIPIHEGGLSNEYSPD